MTRSGEAIHGPVAVILGSLVLIHDSHRYRRSQRDPEFRARLDFHAVLFIARGGDGGLAGAAARQLGLDVLFCEGEEGRHAVDDDADGEAVRFAISRVTQSAHGRAVQCIAVGTAAALTCGL
jgi:hypothetical protein